MNHFGAVTVGGGLEGGNYSVLLYFTGFLAVASTRLPIIVVQTKPM